MMEEEIMSTCGVDMWSEMDGYSKLAPLYEAIHPEREEEVEYYRSLVTDDVHTILDIGCGTGVLTFPMDAARSAHGAGEGYSVGLDASPAMLAQARRRASAIRWVDGDMRKPPVFGSFDLVTCGLNTFQHLLSDADALAMLRAVAERLAPAGIFAFDLFHPDPTYLRPSRQGAFVRSVRIADSDFDLVEDTHYDPVNRILSIVWRLPGAQGGGHDAPFRMRQYWPGHVTALLAEAGLEVVAAHGGFRGESLGPGASRQVYRCRRVR
jgi:SAM-dependent methyltransferase